MRKALPPLLEKYGVQLVLSGHDHYYQRNQVNGITYIVTGGGGAPLHPVGRGPSTLFAEETYHFLRVAVRRDVFAVTGVRLDGSEFDPFSLRLATPAGEQNEPLPIGESVGESVAPVTSAPPVASPPAEMSPLESLSCRRCHQPFRLSNGQLLAYGWDYHRSFLVAGGVSSALVVLALLVMRRRSRLLSSRSVR